ncbi:MAG: type II toxin-antitoxin system RelE/ParE family toxin [Myxococcales bacterium]|nr:type II toxin-antitoxin system RelE/ParE family toxin [Myxococcales bacterium]MCB9649136.1 type II toxin-antitoxin system RelE/ParE family toxin [Deltaproteobacteria bacterium]
MRAVEFYREARLEIEEAVAWYDAQEVSGLGDRLLGEIETALHKARTLPEAFPVVDGRNRRVILKRFPYGLFFREEEHGILVVAFFHSRRDPSRRSGR